MGMAPVSHVLFNKFMTFNPKNPTWVNRDRFVLSYVYLPLLYASAYNFWSGDFAVEPAAHSVGPIS
ncbi:hypothetical protein CC78DRAFT_537238 [Lojkania enalia]|uniref:Transketolase N-terminal domain-containing protein n=1 Tax=Lojkania enalia TaxID=147567 RepID=A0A9P4K210_9PLEO|nr:hypothetical protein CC78DRAFT_537238 [Didymosphaeria enalia]